MGRTNAGAQHHLDMQRSSANPRDAGYHAALHAFHTGSSNRGTVAWINRRARDLRASGDVAAAEGHERASAEITAHQHVRGMTPAQVAADNERDDARNASRQAHQRAQHGAARSHEPARIAQAAADRGDHSAAARHYGAASTAARSAGDHALSSRFDQLEAHHTAQAGSAHVAVAQHHATQAAHHAAQAQAHARSATQRGKKGGTFYINAHGKKVYVHK